MSSQVPNFIVCDDFYMGFEFFIDFCFKIRFLCHGWHQGAQFTSVSFWLYENLVYHICVDSMLNSYDFDLFLEEMLMSLDS